MAQPVVVTFVGIPGSGKTTFAKQLAKSLNGVVLNSDAIRMSMWGSLGAIQSTHTTPDERYEANKLTFGAMNYATKQILNAGISVVYDCNANAHYERNEKHDIADQCNALSIVVRIRVPYDTSLQRIQERNEAHDQRRVSLERAEAVLQRFTKEIEEPAADEISIEISGEEPFEQQLKVFQTKLASLQEQISE